MQDAGGVRLEADHHRVCVPGLGSPHDLVDNVAVSAVHTVEVTDAEDRGTEVAGDVVELAEGLHATVFRRRSPAVSFSDFIIPSEARDLQFAAICRSLASLGMTIPILG